MIREIEVNVAYRWFLGFTLTDKIPHASTFSQNRRRRFNDSPVYQEIFDEIVLQAAKRRMVDGKVLYTDSTHLKASANKRKYDKTHVLKSVRDYVEDLNRDICEDRLKHGKKPLPSKEATPETEEIKVSTVDSDSGYLCPQNQILVYRTTNREGYRGYASNPTDCCSCALRGQCTNSKNGVKLVTRHVWQEYKDEVNSHCYEDYGKVIYKRTKETVERSFADGKELHGHRYARFRGLMKVQAQCLLSAACQNMKKIALVVWRMGPPLQNLMFLAILQPLIGVSTRLKTFLLPLRRNLPSRLEHA